MKNSKAHAIRWLRDAEYTLDQAKKIFSRNEGYNFVCFLGEQTCQKALKAVAYFDGARTVAIHSIKVVAAARKIVGR